jgi:hypothetical protein
MFIAIHAAGGRPTAGLRLLRTTIGHESHSSEDSAFTSFGDRAMVSTNRRDRRINRWLPHLGM